MAVIAVGGLQHETNTFAPHPATFADFEEPGGWPGLSRGAALLDAMAGASVPLAGFVAEAARLGHRIVPLAWAAAGPSGAVTDDAFERLAGLILAQLGDAGPVDAVYLDLHGAMVTASHDDGEGLLLDRVRARIGGRPLVASLDLHANVSDSMVETADLLVAYRTYPHVDMPATGARTARVLDRLLRAGSPPAKRHLKPDFLIPIPWQATVMEPAGSLYDRLETLERDEGCLLSLCMGFPAADVAFCGPSILCYGDDRARVDTAAEALHRAVVEAAPGFAGTIWSAEDAVRRAAGLAGPADKRPVILADVQDNPGAGATADTTGVLAALDEHGGVWWCRSPILSRPRQPTGRVKVPPSRSPSADVMARPGSSRSSAASWSRLWGTGASPPPARCSPATGATSGGWPSSGSNGGTGRGSGSWSPAAGCRRRTRRSSGISGSSRARCRFWSSRARSTSAPTSPPWRRRSWSSRAPV